jgi:S1-C subfamily serine protease
MRFANRSEIAGLFLIALLTLAGTTHSYAQQQGPINVTGTYISTITGPTRNLRVKNRNPIVELQQQGKKITGTFGGKGSEISGEFIGDTIKFSWWSNGYKGWGSWTIVPGSNELVGTWSSHHTGRGNWNLKLAAAIESAFVQGDKNGRDENELIQVSSGSGFSVSGSGHVITNNHVIEGCNQVRIHQQGSTFDSRLIYQDPVNDLALLHGSFVPSGVFGINRGNPSILQEIYVSGYPFGEQVSTSIKVTKGIISSLSGVANNISNIQIDAALQPGNSGGPIFDDKGNIVGVAVAKLDFKVAIKNWGTIPENTNFGVKSSVVVNILESNGINIQEAGDSILSNTELGTLMNAATYRLSCWMTPRQIRKMIATKKLFPETEE